VLQPARTAAVRVARDSPGEAVARRARGARGLPAPLSRASRGAVRCACALRAAVIYVFLYRCSQMFGPPRGREQASHQALSAMCPAKSSACPGPTIFKRVLDGVLLGGVRFKACDIGEEAHCLAWRDRDQDVAKQSQNFNKTSDAYSRVWSLKEGW
jgi:hypothetical protein